MLSCLTFWKHAASTQGCIQGKMHETQKSIKNLTEDYFIRIIGGVIERNNMN